jgi:NADPH2:quinone reductase
VVYDSVGQATFERSLDCISPLGLMVSFGQSSGPVPPFTLGTLAGKGSLFLTRPTLATYIARREDLVRAAEELFQVVTDGAVKIDVRQTYPLAEVERAHRHLESRRTSGSTVLLP